MVETEKSKRAQQNQDLYYLSRVRLETEGQRDNCRCTNRLVLLHPDWTAGGATLEI
jgi:hypothetical protein